MYGYYDRTSFCATCWLYLVDSSSALTFRVADAGEFAVCVSTTKINVWRRNRTY